MLSGNSNSECTFSGCSESQIKIFYYFYTLHLQVNPAMHLSNDSAYFHLLCLLLRFHSSPFPPPLPRSRPSLPPPPLLRLLLPPLLPPLPLLLLLLLPLPLLPLPPLPPLPPLLPLP